MIRVSVILPFYKAAATIERAVRSIRAQSLQDWELLAWDDGGDDGARAIVAAHAREDARIRIMGGEHLGIVEGLRRACAAAEGSYLLRMDADDVALPERLERQVAFMDQHPEVGLSGARVRIAGPHIGSGRLRYESWINGLFQHPDIERELFVECPVPHPTFCLRREAYEQVGGYLDPGWPEDYDLVMRLWQAGWRLGKTEETLLEWHDVPGRLSMSDPRYAEPAFRTLKRHFLFQTYLKDRPIFHQWGAGEVGKRWLRDWTQPRPFAVIDIHPRKIGRTIHGYRVLAPEQLPPPGATFIVVAVGSPGARDDIRAWLEPRGYRELQDFLFLA